MVIKMNKRGQRPTISLMRNRRGWIEIVEAFVAILLIVGVLLIVINRNTSSSQDISTRVYNSEITIIRAIELNDSLRDKIVKSSGFPIEWNSSNFPVDVKNQIISTTPTYLNCVAKICTTDDPCFLTSYSQKDVYSQASFISGTQLTFTPRKINLFCWAK
jgi:hypothetical protein